MKKADYYNIADDLVTYPGAWCFVVWSARGRGKTYGALWEAYQKGIPIAYMKRTVQDVEMICHERTDGVDLSPYVPINRDHGTDIHAKSIERGIGAFYSDDKKPPIAYCIALSAAKTVKGFDLSRVEWFLFDEFIPQSGEIVRHSEGDMVLDLYMTISRDRERRGRDPLKMILFANSERLSCPVTSSLEIMDDMAYMQLTGAEYDYIQERGILLHHVPGDPSMMEGGIYKAMAGTAWARKSFEGDFSNDDTSCVRQLGLKGMRPLYGFTYKRTSYFVYLRGTDGVFYVCSSIARGVPIYDLNKETERSRFWVDYGCDLRSDCIDGRVYCQKYTAYDLIMHFSKIF